MARILLVDNDVMSRRACAEDLEHEGHEVSAVSTGAEALKFVAGQRPDAVVTEVCLPGMDGLDLMARLLADQRSIIVILNCRSAHYRGSFLSWAADAYVVKSSGNRELCNTLGQLLSTDSIPEASTIPRC